MKEQVNCIVVNPADVPTKNKERRSKRDRVDCRKLCRSLRNGELEGIYVPPRSKVGGSQSDSDLLSMGWKQARGNNQIKAMLLFYGGVIPEERGMGHWSRRFIQWIEGIGLERASGGMVLQIHWEELGHLPQIIAKLNRAILVLSRTEA